MYQARGIAARNRHLNKCNPCMIYSRFTKYSNHFLLGCGFTYCNYAFCDMPFCRDDVIKWKHFPCYWPFVRGNHQSPVDSPRKGKWRGALVFSFICAWTNGWVNNRDAEFFRRHRADCDITAMTSPWGSFWVLHLTWYDICFESVNLQTSCIYHIIWPTDTWWGS